MIEENKELNGKKSETSTDKPQAPEVEKKEESIESEADTLKDTESEGSKESEDEKIDYKAELDRLQQERDNYKQGLLSAKDKLKKLKGDSKEDGPEDGDKGQIKEIRDEIRQEIESMKEGFIGDYISDNIKSISENKDEFDLIKYHYDNTIVRSGTSKEAIEQDIRRAKLLANQGRFEREFEELKRTLRSERTKEKNVDYGSQRQQSGPEVELNPVEKQIVERLAKRKGISFEEAKQKFIKSDNV